MKAKQKIRALRALALAGSMGALIVPSAASAMLPRDTPYQPTQSDFASASHQLRKHPLQQPYQLPSSFRTEVQSSAPAQQPYKLPSGFKPEVQTPSSPTVASNPGSVVREIRTVTDNGSPTLAIVLAAIALAIALCASAYGWVRLTRMKRDFSSRALVS